MSSGAISKFFFQQSHDPKRMKGENHQQAGSREELVEVIGEGDREGDRLSVSTLGHLDDWQRRSYTATVRHWRLLMVAEWEAKMAASGASSSGWRVICSCGWTREATSEWAAKSISKLHPQLAQMDVAHVTHVEGPDRGAGGQLSLT